MRVEGLAGRRVVAANRAARGVDEPLHTADLPVRHNNATLHHPDAPAGTTRAAARSGHLLVTTLVLIGVGLRCWEWLQPRSLWLDEQYIALGLREQPYGGLVGVLPYSQSAPVGWVWLEKFLFSIGGDGERLLRTPALLAGCLGVFTAAVLARRLFATPAAVLLTGLVAISPTLVYYCAMVKPYAFDVTATTVLVLFAIRSVDPAFRLGTRWRSG
jgi:dolichyl-phosphate-mannose-protein mannosyltransferase